jgi:hypothetical protein
MGLASFFKNLFGSAKTSAEEMADKAEHIVDETIAKAKENAAPLIEKMEEYAEEAKEKAEETISELIETVKEKSAPIIAKAEELAEEAKEKISETIETAKEKINSFANDGSHDAKEPEATSTNSVEEDAD